MAKEREYERVEITLSKKQDIDMKLNNFTRKILKLKSVKSIVRAYFISPMSKDRE